jgi:hypothetical protein
MEARESGVQFEFRPARPRQSSAEGRRHDTDSGGKLSFYGQDPIIPSTVRFGSMAAIGLAAKAVAVAALWRSRTGEGRDISVDVRKALQRFAGFFERKWELINGRPPAMGARRAQPLPGVAALLRNAGRAPRGDPQHLSQGSLARPQISEMH